jgi:hypothetical protein
VMKAQPKMRGSPGRATGKAVGFGRSGHMKSFIMGFHLHP